MSTANEAGPYVLVGHSYGGLIVRLYASMYPKDVSGLVLGAPSEAWLFSLSERN